MNTIFSANINFGAKYIQNTSILKLDNNNQFHGEQVSVLELLPNEESDIKALERTVNRWGKDAVFGFFILDDMVDIKNKEMSGDVFKIYALSTQNDNFENLKSGKILGLGVLQQSDNYSEIRFLQVDPRYNYSVPKKKYANIGKSLVDFFKLKCKNKELFVQSYFSAANFYEKLGFHITNPSKLLYSWKKLLKK